MFTQIFAPSPVLAPAPASFADLRPSGNFFQRRSQNAKPLLKLIGALRGQGYLNVSGVATPVAYQIDAFSAGAVRLATGGLEGDFGSWPGLADATEGSTGILHLKSGARLAVTIVGSGEGQFEIDLPCNPVLLNQMAGEKRLLNAYD
jgi:hypothetical protein